MNDDEDLRRRFAALRNFDAARAPTFEALRPQAATRRSAGSDARLWRLWKPVAGFAFAAAAALVFFGQPDRTPSEAGGEWAIEAWHMPTDALLDLSSLPGDPLLHEMPSIEVLPIDSFEGARAETPARRIPT